MAGGIILHCSKYTTDVKFCLLKSQKMFSDVCNDTAVTVYLSFLPNFSVTKYLFYNRYDAYTLFCIFVDSSCK